MNAFFVQSVGVFNPGKVSKSFTYIVLYKPNKIYNFFWAAILPSYQVYD